MTTAVDHFRLDGRRALVTGGTRGIGAEIVRLLAAYGADVAFTGRPGNVATAEVDALVADVRAAGRAAYPLELDVRATPTIDGVVGQAAELLGGIDLLVNNAGTNVPQDSMVVDEPTWDLILDTNLKGLFFVTQAVGRRMIATSAGDGSVRRHVVNVASQMGLVALPRRAAYCASKAGVVNLTRALALEWAEHGINVNAVAPTFVRSELADAFLADEGFRTDVLRRIPQGRIADGSEVASAVIALCGPAMSLVTGHTLAVDGGWTAQ